jgi:hypothetical protein
MRRLALLFVFAGSMVCAPRVGAQEPPPPIPRFVVDLHATVPLFPNDSQQLADSRGLTCGGNSCLAELPGRGFGGQVGVHFYLLRWRALTVGVGGEAIVARATSSPSPSADPSLSLVAVEERLVSASPQLSFNFGTGHGWSYLSGGVGQSVWSLHEVGQPLTSSDVEPLETVNYGGGARWFIKNHLAFSLDVHVYEIQKGTPVPPLAGSPRTKLLIVGAGISLK